MNIVVFGTSGEGRHSTHTVTDLSDGTQQRRVTGFDDVLTFTSDSVDARVRTWLPAGLLRTDSLTRDPRFGMLAPLTGRSSERPPSGVVRTIETTRSVSPGFDPPAVHGTWTENLSINGRPPYETEVATTSSSRSVTTTSPEGRTATTTLDAAGRPLSIAVAGLALVEMEYDTHGQLILLEQGGRGWRYGYDPLGRLQTIRDSLARMTMFVNDAANRVTEQHLPGGRQILFDYDDVGNLVSLTPPGQPAHGFDWTAVALTERYRPPSAGMSASLTRYAYNKDRQLTGIERPDSLNVTLDYDATTGRLSSIHEPRGNREFTYTATGLLEGVTSPDGVSLTIAHDGPLDTMETWSGPVSGSVGVGLDRDFRAASQRVNGGSRADFGYDDDGLLTQAGALQIARRADNGIVSGTTLGSVTTTESQTSAGELWKFEARYSGTPLYTAIYDRDSLGRITGITEFVAGGSPESRLKAYAYSDTGFLKTVTVNGTVTERYAYDGNGNRLRWDAPGDSASGDYDAQDRLLRYGDARYEWTAGGDLERKLGPGGIYFVQGIPYYEDTTRYAYDALGNLMRVITIPRDTIEYLVDGRNRRVARRLNGSITHKWLYEDQLRIVAELDTADAVVSRFVYGERPNVPEYMAKGGDTYRLILDHLGSVRLVVNASTGATLQRMDYDAWGNVVEDTNPGFQPFGFAGGLYDAATGLTRFGARDYEAKTGRWTARDARSFDPTQGSLYQYCGADPLNHVDPTGESFVSSAIDALKHMPGTRGAVAGDPVSSYIGDLPAGGGTVTGRCRPPFATIRSGSPLNVVPLDIDAIVVCGRMYKIFGPVYIAGCQVISLNGLPPQPVDPQSATHRYFAERMYDPAIAGPPCDCP